MARKRYRRRRNPKISRRKKTSYLIIGMGVAGGLAAVILWPKILALFSNPTVTVGQPTVTPATIAALLE